MYVYQQRSSLILRECKHSHLRSHSHSRALILILASRRTSTRVSHACNSRVFVKLPLSCTVKQSVLIRCVLFPFLRNLNIVVTYVYAIVIWRRTRRTLEALKKSATHCLVAFKPSLLKIFVTVKGLCRSWK